MFPALKITKAQRQVNGGGFQERNEVVEWPNRGVVQFARKLQPARFFALLSYHRPLYKCGGHKGLSRKQRIDHRRESWQRQIRHH